MRVQIWVQDAVQMPKQRNKCQGQTRSPLLGHVAARMNLGVFSLCSRRVALHQPARKKVTTGDNDDDVGAPAWWACFDHRFPLHSCCLHGTNRVDPVHSAHTWVPEATFSLVRNAQQLRVLIADLSGIHPCVYDAVEHAMLLLAAP